MVSKCCWRESAKRSPETETPSDDGKKETETDSKFLNIFRLAEKRTAESKIALQARILL